MAERLLGTHGFDGISLREIAAAAGQRNFNAVQYHFGSKRGLINAILLERYLQIDEIRNSIIAKRYGASDLSNLDTHDLLRLLWEPAFVLTAEDEAGACCRFQLQYRLHSHRADHPLYGTGPDAVPVEKSLDETLAPSMYLVARRLRVKFPDLDDAGFHKRTAAIDYMFLCSMVEQSNRRQMSTGEGLGLDFESLLAMMTAAMLASPRGG